LLVALHFSILSVKTPQRSEITEGQQDGEYYCEVTGCRKVITVGQSGFTDINREKANAKGDGKDLRHAITPRIANALRRPSFRICKYAILENFHYSCDQLVKLTFDVGRPARRWTR
jgi:hypothetical protein